MGCQLWLGREHLEARGGAAGGDPERNAPDPVVALAMDARGLDNLQRLSSLGFLGSDPSGRPCLRLDTLREHAAGLFLLTGGTARPGVAPAVGGPARGRRGAARRAARGLPRPPRGGAAPPRPRRGARDRAGAARPGRRARPAASSPPTTSTSPSREMHEAHDALLCIAEGRLLAEPNRRRVTPEHWFKPAERHARALRRPAGGLRQHPRHRPPLRGDDGGAQARAAALPQGAARHDRGRDGARHGARAASTARLDAAGTPSRRRASPTRSGSTTSSASSRAWASPATS